MRLRFPGFIGASYNIDSVAIDAQRCVNWYPRVVESGTGKESEVAALVDRPGYSEVANIGADLPQRASLTTSTGVYYTVNGGILSKLDSSFTKTQIGILNTSEGNISMSDNGIDLVIVDGIYAYKVTLATDTFAQITDPDLESFDQVTYQDGYFIFISSNKFQISSLLSTDIDALDFATSEGSPDDIVGGESLERQLYIFNERTTEIFYNSGNADFPFERMEGAFLEIGCAAKHSIVKNKDHLFFVAKDKDGAGLVYKARGANMQKISTHLIEQKISSYGDISEARGWVYQDEGTSFYVLNFVGAGTTWVYDINTGMWHERTYTNDGIQERDRGFSHAYAYATHLVGDYETGSIYKMSRDFYSDNGDEIVCVRTCPHISATGLRVKYTSMELDMESGTGLDGTAQGTNPKAMLTFSNDGGYTFGNEIWTDIGKIGERGKRIKWNRLGQSRDRVFKVQISDPVRRVLIGANLETEVSNT